MQRILRLSIFVITLFVVNTIFASTYFVSPSGSNINSGTLSQPFQTVQYALNQLQAGDILKIRAGNYNEKLEFYESGTSSQEIIIQNYDGETPVIDGSGITDKDVLLYMENVSFVTIDGLHFKNNTVNDGGGILAQGACHDLTIKNNKISNISFSTDLNANIGSNTNASPLLIYADTAPDSAYNIVIKNNEVYDNVTGYSENISLDGNISNFEISNNIVHDNTNIGIDVLGNYNVSPMSQFDHARYGVVKSNTIYNCNAPENTAAGIYVDGGHHVVVENNISHHNGYGGEIGCEESGTTDDVIFRNNIFYNNFYTGMQLGGYAFVNTGGKVVNSKVLNNTFYKNDLGNNYNGELAFTQFENGVVENNIFYLSDQNVISNATLAQPNLSFDYNLFFNTNGENQLEGDWGNQSYTSFATFKTSSSTNANSSFADPQFVNPNANDFHLNSNSPAIDAGNPNFSPDANEFDIDGLNRMNGGRVDCGADESLSSSNPTASEEMTFKSVWDEQNSSTSGVKYNDVWGYVDCQGNEYAILGSADHVHIIDVTNPTQPSEVKRFTPGSTTIWRDFKTYRTFAYGVADQGNEGLLVFDLTNLPSANISMVNQITTDFTKCHNIFIDETYGKLYVVGSNTLGNGVIVYDISQDPANPVKIASPSLSPGGYIHDAYVKNNILYGSHGYNGFHIWDFTDPANPVHLASAQTNGYNHSNWVSDDGQYAFVAEEVPSGLPLLTVDISNMANDDIEVVKEFKDPLLAPAHTNSTPHNPYVRGHYLITSYYEDGVQIHDISDPLNPVLVAYYDTEPMNTAYNGTRNNWGVYPYFPSGNIIASDTKHGLFVLRADNITLAPIQATTAPVVEIGAEGGNIMCFGEDKQLVATQGAESFKWYKDGSLFETTLNETITITEPGNYFVAGFSGYCSTASSTLQITMNDEIDVPITTTLGDVFCSNEVNTLSAPDGFAYQWSDNSTTQSIDINTVGTYKVTVTDEIGCSASNSISVQTITAPIPTIEATSDIICGDETITITANGGDSYVWQGGQTTNAIDVNESGIYMVTVSLENGCSETTEIEILQGEPINAIIETSNGQQICAGDETELTVTTASSYLWDNGMTTQNRVVTEGGLYSVTVSNEAGCTSVAQIQIGVLPIPNGEIIGSSSLCNNSSIILTATGGASYLWNTSATTNEITVSEAGMYSVTITNAAGCTQVVEHGVTNLPNLSPTIESEGNILCNDESLVLTATGGTVFEWSNGSHDNKITINESGDYVVTVSDENGCSGVADITILSSSFDFEIEGDLSLCSGSTGTLTATDGVTWAWSNGGTSQTIEITDSGTYSVTATSSDGCSKTKTITVENAGNIEVFIDSESLILCPNASLTLYANPPNETYQWSNGATSESISIDTPGDYTVTVTNASGCTGVNTVAIAASSFQVEIEGDQSICQEGTLSATTGVQWLWSTSSTTQSIQISSPGEYSVTATDNNGCTSVASINVTQADALMPTIEIIDGSCETVTLGLSTLYTSYSWSNGATSPTTTVNESGKYTVTVTNFNGCTGVAEIDVTIQGVNAQISGPEKFCKNTQATLTASGGNQFLWNTNATEESIDVSNPGHYIVTVTDENGCTGVADFVIENYPNTEVVIETNDVPLCVGNTVTLTTSGSTFVWSTDATTASIDITESGVYQVTVTDENGCSNDNEIEINFNSLPQGNIISSNGLEFCEGEMTTLSIDNASEFVDITWYSDDNIVGTQSELSTEVSGIYSANLSLNGCENQTDAIEITVNQPVVPVITQSGKILSSTTASTYQWYYNNIKIGDQTEQTMTPTISGDYYVVTTDENGCEAKSNTINVIISSLDDIEWISKTNLFPNPTRQLIHLAIDSKIKEDANIQIRNILGQVFLQEKIVILANENTFQFNVGGFPSGMYFLEIEADGQMEELKFVVEK